MSREERIKKAEQYLDYMLENKQLPYMSIPAKEDDWDLLFKNILQDLKKLDELEEKIEKFIDKNIEDINSTLNVKQNTSELKQFYKTLRIEFEGQNKAYHNILDILGGKEDD